MKSKMKSTFAIIAVALMVMVAVVPMVGVFTSDSNAAVADYPIPSTDTDTIKITVSVYKADGTTPVANDADSIVKISYGSYTWTKATTAGVSEFTIHESAVNSLTISYVDSDGNKNPNYTDVTLSNLVGSETTTNYSAKMIAGKVTRTVPLMFKNGSVTYEGGAITAYNNSFNDDIVTGISSLSYAVYNAEEDGNKIGEGEFTITKGETGISKGVFFGTFAYSSTAAITANKVYLELSSLRLNPVSSTMTVNDTARISVFVGTTAEDFAKACVPIVKQDLVTLAPNALFKSEVTVNSFVEEVTGEGAPTPATFTVINGKNKLMAGDEPVNAYYSGIPTTGAYTITYKATLAVDSTTSGALAVDKDTGVITLAKHFGGTVKFGTSTEAGVFKGKIATGDETTESFTAKVDGKGNFFIFLTAEPAGTKAITEPTLTVKVGSTDKIFKVNEAVYNAAGTALTLTGEQGDNTYVQISGTLYVSVADVEANKISATLTVSGSPTFGSLTAVSGAFSFYAVQNSSLMFSVSGAKLSGDINTVATTGGVAGLKLIMDTKDIVIKVTDSTANKIEGLTAEKVKVIGSDDEAIWYEVASSSNEYTITTRADETGAKVYFIGVAGYTFAAEDEETAVALTDGTTYAALNGKYIVQMRNADGDAVYIATATSASTYVNLFKATVYKNSNNTYIYSYDNTVKVSLADAKFVSTDATNNAYSFDALATEMASKDVGTTPVDVVIAVPLVAGITAAKSIYEPIYILKADSKGKCYFEGYYDSVEGKLTRLDKTTPIAGAAVDLLYDDAVVSTGTVYTDSKGEFTVYSSKLIDVDTTDTTKWKVQFNKTGYAANDKIALFDKLVKKSAFTMSKDAYTFTYHDADGAVIDLTGVTTNINNAAVAGAYKWAVGDEVTVTMTEDIAGPLTVTYRTFSTHVITADEVKTGIIDFVSDQKTYTVSTVDADEGIIGEVNLALYYYENDVPIVKTVGTAAPAGYITDDTTGTVSFLLPFIDQTVAYNAANNKTDAPGTEYALLATKEGQVFSTTPVKIAGVDMVIASAYEKMTFIVLDADGENLVGATMGTAAVYKDGELLNGALASQNVTVLGVTYKAYIITDDPEADYTFTIAATTGTVYTFPEAQEPTLGFLYANENWVVGDIVDGAGNSIGVNNTTKVKAYVGNEPVWTSLTYAGSAATGYYYKILVNEDLVTGYGIDSTTLIEGYTFEISESPLIVANESSVFPAFVASNAIPAAPAAYSFKAYYANGAVKAADGTPAAPAELIVDESKVLYYGLTVTTATDGYFKAGESYDSLSNIIASPYMKVTGSLPVAAATGDYVSVELWKNGVVVDGFIDQLAASDLTYEAWIDVSGADETAGVAFDSITATYVHNGAVYAVSTVDPTSAYNPIVVIDQKYAAVLNVPADIAAHVKLVTNGNIVSATADKSFFVIADGTTYVDGQYKYTFAGWYVNGQAVTGAGTEYAFELTEDVVVSAQYDVVYEKISDVNDVETPAEKGIDTNVLIIGICAVIVALIAVVYAVIKKE